MAATAFKVLISTSTAVILALFVVILAAFFIPPYRELEYCLDRGITYLSLTIETAEREFWPREKLLLRTAKINQEMRDCRQKIGNDRELKKRVNEILTGVKIF